MAISMMMHTQQSDQNTQNEQIKTVCGYVAIIGRPNVGKSTLLNVFLGKKISITSRKPQTTRHRILGIKTVDHAQIIFVDTPGIHQQTKGMLNRYMNRTANAVLKDVDCILWVVDAKHWTNDDELVCHKLQNLTLPVLLVINKVDVLTSNDAVLPVIARLANKLPKAKIVPISAKKIFNIDSLEKLIIQHLPQNGFFFAPAQMTDRTENFMAAEFIREKLVRLLGQELPYATMVAIESFAKKKTILHISAIIWVEKIGQKGIVIGKQGEMLKKIGCQARLAMEKYFEQKIFMQLWVKVKESWSEDERIVRELLS